MNNKFLHYQNVLTRKFYEEYYVGKRLSYPKLSKLLLRHGHNISISSISKYARMYGVSRNRSEARRNWDPGSLDYGKSFLNKDLIAVIDGFLLGDGRLACNKRSPTKVARFFCGVEYEEFCRYLMASFGSYDPKITKQSDASMRQGFYWCGLSRFHPDLYKQHERWYRYDANGKLRKQVPDDVCITPESVMMWYLGDGTLINPRTSPQSHLQLNLHLYSNPQILV